MGASKVLVIDRFKQFSFHIRFQHVSQYVVLKKCQNITCANFVQNRERPLDDLICGLNSVISPAEILVIIEFP